MKEIITLSITAIFVFSSAMTALADTTKGQGIYMNFCASCHDSGLAGAPKLDDKENWQKRLNKGEDAVIKNAINGYQGETGFMPAKGGMSSLSDEEVTAAVRYMIKQSE